MVAKLTKGALGLAFTIALIVYSFTLGGVFVKYFTILFQYLRILIEATVLQKVVGKSDNRLLREIPRKFTHLLITVLGYNLLFYSFAWGGVQIHFIIVSLLIFIFASISTLYSPLTEYMKRAGSNNDLAPVYYSLSMVITSVISYFNPQFLIPSYCGMIALAVGDTFGAFVGIAFGKHKIHGHDKSIEGSLAFIISTLVALLIMITPLQAVGFFPLLIIACFGGLVELYSGDYDNLLIPILVAIFTYFII